jgi:hypothetical protein
VSSASASGHPLAERIARGRAAVERAQAQGRDTAAWERHLAQLETQYAGLLQDELDVLLGVIADGCRLGLHGHLDRVPAEIIASVLAAHDGSDEEFRAACHRAGAAAVLATAVQQYRRKLHRLSDLGHDTSEYGAALESCLSHPTSDQTEERDLPMNVP